MVLCLVAIVNYDVFARGIFNAPFRGAVEIVQFTLVLIVFLQLPDVIRVGRLTRSDGFLSLIRTKRPKLFRVLNGSIHLLSTIVMTLIAIAIFPDFLEMWDSKDYFGIPGVFTAPWWPIKLVIFISAILCTIQFLIRVFGGNRMTSTVTRPED